MSGWEEMAYVRIFAPGAEEGSIAQEHRDAEKPPGGGGFVSFG